MRRCPKCGKCYDDSFKVCVICPKTQLNVITPEDEKKIKEMIVTTTNTVEGRKIKSYLGVVSGVVVTGFGMFREFLSGFTDTLGGQSGSYQDEYKKGKELAIVELKQEAIKLSGDAVVGIRLDFESISSKAKSFIMVTATGTAVQLERD